MGIDNESEFNGHEYWKLCGRVEDRVSVDAFARDLNWLWLKNYFRHLIYFRNFNYHEVNASVYHRT